MLCGKNLEEDGECLEEHYDSPSESEGNEGREDENWHSDKHNTMMRARIGTIASVVWMTERMMVIPREVVMMKSMICKGEIVNN